MPACRDSPASIYKPVPARLIFDDISAFAKKASWAGIPIRYEIWEGMFHSWQIFGKQIPEARDAVSRAGTFAREAFGR